MTVMTPNAPKVPANTTLRDSFSASSTAMKNVLSPSSENRISRNPDSAPSLKGLSPSTPGAHHMQRKLGCLAVQDCRCGP